MLTKRNILACAPTGSGMYIDRAMKEAQNFTTSEELKFWASFTALHVGITFDFASEVGNELVILVIIGYRNY